MGGGGGAWNNYLDRMGVMATQGLDDVLDVSVSVSVSVSALVRACFMDVSVSALVCACFMENLC